jgi:hypothetical protein
MKINVKEYIEANSGLLTCEVSTINAQEAPVYNIYVKPLEEGFSFFPLEDLSECIVVNEEEFQAILENKVRYNFETKVLVPYNDPAEKIIRIEELKQKLTETDYQAIKYAEGVLTEEEYAPIKAQRQEWRAEINKLEAEIN